MSMKKELLSTILQQEFFEISLNVEDSRISAIELIGLLSNTEVLFKSINQTLNSKFSVGYDSISIDVLALERGSFKIPLCVNKVVSNPIFASTAGTLLGGLALNLLSNNPKPQTVLVDIDHIVIENKDLLNNRKTIHTVGNIAKMALETDGIRDITITYEKSNGARERTCISKEILSEVANIQEELVENIQNIQTNVVLEIVSPVFKNKPTLWKVLYNGLPITAKMADQDFLETMDIQRIAFAKGDVIVADIESIATNTEKGIKLRHYIRKVHSYPRYTKITRKGKIEQTELFEESD